MQNLLVRGRNTVHTKNLSLYLRTVGHMYNLLLRGGITGHTKNSSQCFKNSDHPRIPEILCSFLVFSVDPLKFGGPRPALLDFYCKI